MSEATHWVLTFVCADKPGIVHAVSGAIVAANGNITESQQFSSDDTVFLHALAGETTASREEAPTYDMQWRLDVVGRPCAPWFSPPQPTASTTSCSVSVQVSPVEIPLVLSNHDEPSFWLALWSL
jgi:formyltetrahydrofolate deformylase